MKNYDQLKDFIDYTDRGAWKEYIQDLAGLWRDAFTLKEFHEGLKQEFQNLPLTSVRDEDQPLL
ncbi:MAG: hypothetical protein KGY45_03585, partial [Hadesarchaea archaeon]|nr:hypothetical protein [Hadesarchaea archaeon]